VNDIEHDQHSLRADEFMTKSVRHQVGFGFLWACFSLIGWRPLVDTFALSLRNDEYTHILLILPISAALIFLKRGHLREIVTLNIRLGAAFLAMAVLVACFGIGRSASLPLDVRLSVGMLALAISWIGAFVLCFGAQASRSVAFPLCFLFGLVPFPQVALNAIVAFLQQGSAWAAHGFFASFGIPVMQDGILVTIPGLTLQVAQECSSIRSSSMLLVTTMVLAQLLLRSPWRKALVISLAIPLSVAKNGLRIFSIAMLGTRVDRGYLTGRFHHQGGIIFFAIALVSIFALIWIIGRGEDSSPSPDSTSA
jgi:exosortase